MRMSGTKLGRTLALIASTIGLGFGLLLLSPINWTLGRPIAKLSLGTGRTLLVWSEEEWLEPGYPGMYYRVEADGRVVVPKTWIGTDTGVAYRWKVAFARQSKLAAVYEASESGPFPLIIWDEIRRESWPRTGYDQGGYWKDNVKAWIGRYGCLKAENSAIPGFLGAKASTLLDAEGPVEESPHHGIESRQP